jgi:hypothetical protein
MTSEELNNLTKGILVVNSKIVKLVVKHMFACYAMLGLSGLTSVDFLYTHTHTHTHMHVHICMHIYVCIYICIYGEEKCWKAK